ncbi:hypothetical protein ACQ4PT_043524 [Festuca glaucescens]
MSGKGKKVHLLPDGVVVGDGSENLLTGGRRPAKWTSPAGVVGIRLLLFMGVEHTIPLSKLSPRRSTSGWPRCTPRSHPGPGSTHPCCGPQVTFPSYCSREASSSMCGYLEMKTAQELCGVDYFHH